MNKLMPSKNGFSGIELAIVIAVLSIFSAVAIESYLTVFEEEDALDNFEKFASLNGPNFYNVSPNKEKLKIVSRPNKIKEFIDVVEEKNIVGQIKPFHAGEILQWQVEGIVN